MLPPLNKFVSRLRKLQTLILTESSFCSELAKMLDLELENFNQGKDAMIGKV